MKRIDVEKIIRENKTDYNGVVMYELTLYVSYNGGYKKGYTDVILLEEDYKMIKEKGYYYA